MNDFFKHKAFLWTVFAVVILIALILFARWMTRIAPQAKDSTQNIQVDKFELSYEMNKYNLLADQIFAAMNGFGINGDSVQVVILQLRTKADWDQLVKSYGVRTLKSFGLTTCHGNLIACLSDELPYASASVQRTVKNHLAQFGAFI
jgi:hypothetical protein